MPARASAAVAASAHAPIVALTDLIGTSSRSAAGRLPGRRTPGPAGLTKREGCHNPFFMYRFPDDFSSGNLIKLKASAAGRWRRHGLSDEARGTGRPRAGAGTAGSG